MALIYAMSDIHGETELLKEMLNLVDLQDPNNILILLGDYISSKGENFEALFYIKNLQEQYKNQVIVLAGNHEFMFLEDISNKTISFNDKSIITWVKSLPYYYETDTQIFVHAGVDEDAEEYWKLGTEDYHFCCKYPHTIGKFYKDIIAGHIGTSTIANDEDYHQVFWDSKSHFYIDGTTEISKIIPLLKYNTATKKYFSYEKITDENGIPSWIEYFVAGARCD